MTTNPDTATDVPTDADVDLTPETFVFEALVRFVNGHLEALVRYDGDGDALKAGARQIGVTVEPTDDDADGNRRVRITGSTDAVERAIQEYARRAAAEGRYSLGDLGVAGWSRTY